MMNTLLWFQRDLRLHHNPALNWAIQQGKPIIAIYIHSPEEDAPWSEGAASRWWLHHSLKKLSAELLKLGITLHFFRGNSVEIITQLVTDNSVSATTWTKRCEPQRRTCEHKIEQHLNKHNIEVKQFQDGLLAHPNQFLTASNKTAYKVFTPFYKKLRSELQLTDFFHNTTANKKPDATSATLKNPTLKLEQLKLLDQYPWHEKLHAYWSPGELSALEKLDYFVDNVIKNYATQREFPASNGTSSLSPHLHFGEISPRQVITVLVPLIEIQDGQIANAAEAFMRQIIWREFARYILWHYPQTATQSMNAKFKQSFWTTNSEQLRAWQQGKTGIAIIDAGMKQLWNTGWMHNRVRMLVASLLTKNMGISWQDGAHWFWDTLVDADLANNSMGWQWVAGCGVDAAPYFRIFNPVTQEHRFDKQKSYINLWLADKETNKPILDLASSRTTALEKYKQLTRN